MAPNALLGISVPTALGPQAAQGPHTSQCCNKNPTSHFSMERPQTLKPAQKMDVSSGLRSLMLGTTSKLLQMRLFLTAGSTINPRHIPRRSSTGPTWMILYTSVYTQVFESCKLWVSFLKLTFFFSLKSTYLGPAINYHPLSFWKNQVP